MTAPYGDAFEPRIEGFAVIFGRADNSGDIVFPGAFAVSLRSSRPRTVRMLLNHDPAMVVGAWIDVQETDRGLWVSGYVAAEWRHKVWPLWTPPGSHIDGLSIGFRTLRATHFGGGRQLHSVDLWEVSLVPEPMQPEARFSITNSTAREGDVA